MCLEHHSILSKAQQFVASTADCSAQLLLQQASPMYEEGPNWETEAVRNFHQLLPSDLNRSPQWRSRDFTREKVTFFTPKKVEPGGSILRSFHFLTLEILCQFSSYLAGKQNSGKLCIWTQSLVTLVFLKKILERSLYVYTVYILWFIYIHHSTTYSPD